MNKLTIFHRKSKKPRVSIIKMKTKKKPIKKKNVINPRIYKKITTRNKLGDVIDISYKQKRPLKWYKAPLTRSKKTVYITRKRNNFFYFTYKSICKTLLKRYRFHEIFFLANSKKRFGKRKKKDRLKFARRKAMSRILFSRRYTYKRLPRLFFFWFVILYSDLNNHLSKIVWNNWFKFLYLSYDFTNFNRLFYQASDLYQVNYLRKPLYFTAIPNNFFYSESLFLTRKFRFSLASFLNYFLNGSLIYNLRFISLTSSKNINLYIFRPTYVSKKNIKLNRFFVFKF